MVAKPQIQAGCIVVATGCRLIEGLDRWSVVDGPDSVDIGCVAEDE